MRIGIFQSKYPATSVRLYTDNVVAHLKEFGNQIFFFSSDDALPDVDVIWDPTCTGARYPNRKILSSNIPWVITLHGAAILSTPLSYNFSTLSEKIKGLFTAIRRWMVWMVYKYKVAQIITVSEYAKEELIKCLGMRSEQIAVIYHGYEKRWFNPSTTSKDYLLHVSAYQPKKNVDRIIEAYQSIAYSEKLPLVVICPGYNKSITDKKITIIDEVLSSEQVAAYMKGAYTFIFPSLHESFGMPLLEAMACGTPVITSNTSACPEIIQQAGLLVDPLSVTSIRSAIHEIMSNKDLHTKLSSAAIHRAQYFSWETAAWQHEAVFRKVFESKKC